MRRQFWSLAVMHLKLGPPCPVRMVTLAIALMIANVVGLADHQATEKVELLRCKASKDYDSAERVQYRQHQRLVSYLSQGHFRTNRARADLVRANGYFKGALAIGTLAG